MRRYCNENEAATYARAQGKCYGHSVFSRGWYVGTREQLDAIGVFDIHEPQNNPFRTEYVKVGQ